MIRLIALMLMLGLLATGSARAQGTGSPTLDAVRARGFLLCGTSGEIVGFSLVDSTGVMRGLDADSCRAIAAAVLGDAEKIKYVPLTAQNRFTALQSGEADVLIRNTGWSLSRETSLGLLFASINFWDGTSIIVKTASGVKSVTGLGGATICVRPGTTTELDLADWARSAGIKFTPVLINEISAVQDAFLSGRCDAYVTDSSQVAGFRYRQGPRASELTILPEPIGTGPSGAAVRKGDDKWFDIVRWTHFALVTAENLGVTSKNVDSFATTANPDIKRLLGQEGGLGKSMGLDNRWAYQAIKQVGNYGEMFERNIGPLGLPRGPNRLASQGGLQFSPQLR